MKPNIELHIEELVLHGFSTREAYRIRAAVQLEITRLLQEQGLPPAFSVEANMGDLNAGHLNILPNAKAEAVGNDIAHSVYKGFASE